MLPSAGSSECLVELRAAVLVYVPGSTSESDEGPSEDLIGVFGHEHDGSITFVHCEFYERAGVELLPSAALHITSVGGLGIREPAISSGSAGIPG